jgi:phosphatidylglycerol:prolipoprotein diacylglycerol transferase
MYPPVDPISFEIGRFALRWYGRLMLAAILTAATIAGRYVARQGENPDNLWDMLFWILIPGFIGAR